MIPGAMIALALALLLELDHANAIRLAAFGAIGIGFGGQETHGQTVGLSLQPETFWWAILGFAIKGGVWGLHGGASLGIALAPLSRKRILASLGAMGFATYAGWKLINEPKLIYFSNLHDKPRAELWAGLLLGGAALAAMSGAPASRRFASWGALGGAAGFALGAVFQALGRMNELAPWFDWWKLMEFTFGALLGLALGWAAKPEPAAAPTQEDSTAASLWTSLLGGAAVCAVIIGIEYYLPWRINYTLAGALALAAVAMQPRLAPHVAITTTICAFVLDLIEHRQLSTFVLAAAAPAAWFAARRVKPTELFLFLMWSAVAVSLLKSFLPPPVLRPGAILTQSVFVAMALLCTACARGLPRSFERQ
jgi:hypothetical protein